MVIIFIPIHPDFKIAIIMDSLANGTFKIVVITSFIHLLSLFMLPFFYFLFMLFLGFNHFKLFAPILSDTFTNYFSFLQLQN